MQQEPILIYHSRLCHIESTFSLVRCIRSSSIAPRARPCASCRLIESIDLSCCWLENFCLSEATGVSFDSLMCTSLTSLAIPWLSISVDMVWNRIQISLFPRQTPRCSSWNTCFWNSWNKERAAATAYAAKRKAHAPVENPFCTSLYFIIISNAAPWSVHVCSSSLLVPFLLLLLLNDTVVFEFCIRWRVTWFILTIEDLLNTENIDLAVCKLEYKWRNVAHLPHASTVFDTIAYSPWYFGTQSGYNVLHAHLKNVLSLEICVPSFWSIFILNPTSLVVHRSQFSP